MFRSFFAKNALFSKSLAVAVTSAGLGIKLLIDQLTSPVWLKPVAWVFILLATLAFVVSLVASYFKVEDFLEQRRNAVRVLSPSRWTCYYWPGTGSLRIVVPMDINSDEAITQMECEVRLGGHEVSLQLMDRPLRVGEFIPGRCVPEFVGNIAGPLRASIAVVSFKVKMHDGVSRQALGNVPIQVIGN